jgi:hypothetical protein
MRGRRFRGALSLSATMLLLACGAGGSTGGAGASEPETVTAVTGPPVESTEIEHGRDENTEILSIDDDTVAAIDGASKDETGAWHLAVWLGDPNGSLTPRRLDGPPLVFVDAFTDDDAVVIVGLECPGFVGRVIEEGSTDDTCGTQPRRRLAYRLSTTDGTWRLLNSHLPEGSLAKGDGTWAVIEASERGETFSRLDVRSGALTPIATLDDGRNWSEGCTAGDAMVVVRSTADGRYPPYQRHPKPTVALVPGTKVSLVRNGRLETAEPPPAPIPLRDGVTHGCLPGVGILFYSFDWQQFAVLTQKGGALDWTVIPAAPPGARGPITIVNGNGNVLVGWAPREQFVGFVFVGGQWHEVGSIDGSPPQRAVLVGDQLVYEKRDADTNRLGVVGG